jgi:S-adenosylhomocysteine hydrolase
MFMSATSTAKKACRRIPHGFKVITNIRDLLPKVDMPISATGNNALGIGEFERMKDEAYVSATSADDKMHRKHLVLNGYLRLPINNGATVKYAKDQRSIYLVADGEAANFLHCGSRPIYSSSADVSRAGSNSPADYQKHGPRVRQNSRSSTARCRRWR